MSSIWLLLLQLPSPPDEFSVFLPPLSLPVPPASLKDRPSHIIHSLMIHTVLPFHSL